MFVTRHTSVVDPLVTERFWDVYARAYQPTMTETVTREMLYRTEFDAVLASPFNRTWALWDDDRLAAMMVIATGEGVYEYLSRDYLEREFGEQVRRSAVHYVVFMAVHPGYATKGAVFKLIQEPFHTEADEGAVLIFDTPQMNQQTERGGMREMTRRLAASTVGGVPIEDLQVHRYYAANFAESPRGRAAREANEVDAEDLTRA